MDATLAIANNGMTAADFRQTVIADNLANQTTDGFKARLVDQATIAEPSTRITGTRKNLVDPGQPRQTGQPHDFFIAGDGFFQVQLNDGVGYTRAGNFSVDPDGKLVAPTGHILVPEITLEGDATRVEVTRDGRVFQVLGDQQIEVGQLELARFINPSGLESIGDNLFVETVASGDAEVATPGEEGYGSILQRYVEASNVDPTVELPSLMLNQRYQQFNLRVFQTADSLIGRALDLFS